MSISPVFLVRNFFYLIDSLFTFISSSRMKKKKIIIIIMIIIIINHNFDFVFFPFCVIPVYLG